MASLDDRVEYTAFHDSGNGEMNDHFLAHKEVNRVSVKGGE